MGSSRLIAESLASRRMSSQALALNRFVMRQVLMPTFRLAAGFRQFALVSLPAATSTGKMSSSTSLPYLLASPSLVSLP